MKKILYLVQLPPPEHGVSKVNSALIHSNILNSHYKTIVIPIKFSDNLSDINKFTFRKIILTFKLIFKLLTEILKEKPDLIYFTISPYGKAFYRDFLLVILAKTFAAKMVIHIHGLGIQKNSSSKFYSLLSSFIYKNTYTIHLSQSILNDFLEYKNLVKKQFIVNNGILDVCAQDTVAHNLYQKTKVQLVYISNYLSTKGHDALIDALFEIKNKNIEFQCIFAGSISDEKYFQHLKETVLKYNMDKYITFLDFIDGVEKNQLLDNSDIFIFPTKFEAFGIVALEAMMHQLPVVANRIGSLEEILDNNAGFTYNTQSELISILDLLIQNQGIRSMIGKNARQRFLENYTIERFEENMKKVFDEILVND